MPAETAMEAGGDGFGRNLRQLTSAGMIAVAVVTGAFVQAVSAGFSPIDDGRFLEGSAELWLVSIAAHLVLAAAVAVHPGPRRIPRFAAALAARRCTGCRRCSSRWVPHCRRSAGRSIAGCASPSRGAVGGVGR